jgi:hypothetical protein
MTNKFIAGGCSFTFGHELGDEQDGKVPSKRSWAHGLYQNYSSGDDQFVNTAHGGIGNTGIARRVFQEVSKHPPESIKAVFVMWTFVSRYEWAFPRHKLLENQRWASISPWDTNMGAKDRHRRLANSEVQLSQWRDREKRYEETGVKSFADSLYRYAANWFHETYLSWNAIIWLQNILEKKKIPFMFTLADNTLFYKELVHHKDSEPLLDALHKEIDITKWFSFGDRMMGFNQWARLNSYEYGVTHPLDKAHEDAIMLMKPKFDNIIGGQR